LEQPATRKPGTLFARVQREELEIHFFDVVTNLYNLQNDN
jgi:hypothetical protein